MSTLRESFYMFDDLLREIESGKIVYSTHYWEKYNGDVLHESVEYDIDGLYFYVCEKFSDDHVKLTFLPELRIINTDDIKRFKKYIRVKCHMSIEMDKYGME